MERVRPARTSRPSIVRGRGFRLKVGAAAIAFACALPGLASAAARHFEGAGQSSGLASAPDEPSSLDELLAWVLLTGDNRGQPFVIVDKLGALAKVFDRTGALTGTAPVLLGVAQGDDSPPGIGDRPLADIGPADRITPAGRFTAALGENLTGKTVLWVDYDAAVSLHRVATGRPSERRQARLDSPTPTDNRISYGCINVPAQFYDTVIEPLFTDSPGIVYVLPETRSLETQFFSQSDTN